MWEGGRREIRSSALTLLCPSPTGAPEAGQDPVPESGSCGPGADWQVPAAGPWGAHGRWGLAQPSSSRPCQEGAAPLPPVVVGPAALLPAPLLGSADWVLWGPTAGSAWGPAPEQLPPRTCCLPPPSSGAAVGAPSPGQRSHWRSAVALSSCSCGRRGSASSSSSRRGGTRGQRGGTGGRLGCWMGTCGSRAAAWQPSSWWSVLPPVSRARVDWGLAVGILSRGLQAHAGAAEAALPPAG